MCDSRGRSRVGCAKRSGFVQPNPTPVAVIVRPERGEPMPHPRPPSSSLHLWPASCTAAPARCSASRTGAKRTASGSQRRSRLATVRRTGGDHDRQAARPPASTLRHLHRRPPARLARRPERGSLARTVGGVRSTAPRAGEGADRPPPFWRSARVLARGGACLTLSVAFAILKITRRAVPSDSGGPLGMRLRAVTPGPLGFSRGTDGSAPDPPPLPRTEPRP